MAVEVSPEFEAKRAQLADELDIDNQALGASADEPALPAARCPLAADLVAAALLQQDYHGCSRAPTTPRRARVGSQSAELYREALAWRPTIACPAGERSTLPPADRAWSVGGVFAANVAKLSCTRG
jgi:hypothetical protein